jgi:superfamily II DNA or RNA helicase
MRRAPELLKRADLLPGVQLQEHQQRAADAGADPDKPMRTLMYHSLGSGKTLTSLAAAEAHGQPYTAVAPASLRANYQGERERFTDQKTPATLMSYTQLGSGKPTDNVGTVVFDEAHRLRNPESAQGRNAQALAARARNLVLLSGTPIVNEPGDLAPLVSMLKNKKLTPEEFNNRYVSTEKVYPNLFYRLMGMSAGDQRVVSRPDELKALLQGHVDYYDPGKPVVPTHYEDVHVDMGREQTQLYNAMWNKLPWYLRWKLSNDFPLSQQELSRTLSFMTGPRQVSLSTYPYLRDKDPHRAFEQSTKLQKAHELMQAHLASNPQTKALVFSNFIDAGLTPYAAALQKAGVPHGVFHGGLSDAQRKQLVEDYNNNKIRVALLGPSGTEGLSFKGTQLIQQLDPYWNPVRGRQAVGRGLRYDSHWGLPPDLQNVKVQRFVSRLPLGLKDSVMSSIGFDREKNTHGADDHLRAIEARKTRLNQQFLDILKEVGSRPE